MRYKHLEWARPKKADRLKALGLEALEVDEVSLTVRVRIPKRWLGKLRKLSAKERGQAIAAWIEQKGVGNGKEEA